MRCVNSFLGYLLIGRIASWCGKLFVLINKKVHKLWRRRGTMETHNQGNWDISQLGTRFRFRFRFASLGTSQTHKSNWKCLALIFALQPTAGLSLTKYINVYIYVVYIWFGLA